MQQRQALHRHVITNGISYRDDSILVNGYLNGYSDRFTVRSPEFFADAYPHTPTVFELEHYGTVKRLGNWEGCHDSLVAKHGRGKTGQDYFRGALQLLHATYIGYHGYAHEWLADNPEFTSEMLNQCGYWLFPISVEWLDLVTAGGKLLLALTLENRGVAPPYHPYELRLKLDGNGSSWTFTVAHADKTWLPGTPIVLRRELAIPPEFSPGKYDVSVGLFDRTSGGDRPVEFALKEHLRDSNGYYPVATIGIARSQ